MKFLSGEEKTSKWRMKRRAGPSALFRGEISCVHSKCHWQGTHHACKVSQDVKLSVTVSRLFIIFFRGTRDLLEVSVPKAHR